MIKENKERDGLFYFTQVELVSLFLFEEEKKERMDG